MLPAGLTVVRRTPVFDEQTMPPGLRRNHRTAAGVWGVIRVIEGRLLFRTIEPSAKQIIDLEHCAEVRPGQLHEIEPLGPVRFFVEFYRDPAAQP
ncbi:MAG: DUF1971 domain-containing protein [Alphaproteobacteria bacterium]|nr:DUF1971 domain-containing protein [Alphaproteobacteria bacterium]